MYLMGLVILSPNSSARPAPDHSFPRELSPSLPLLFSLQGEKQGARNGGGGDSGRGPEYCGGAATRPALRDSVCGGSRPVRHRGGPFQRMLETPFSLYGMVESCKVATGEKGSSKGFGFVQMNSEVAAIEALLAMSKAVVELNVSGIPLSDGSTAELNLRQLGFFLTTHAWIHVVRQVRENSIRNYTKLS